MKLIFCPVCCDVVKLGLEMRFCECRKSFGRYVDMSCAEISRGSIPLGITNVSFMRALGNRPESGMGESLNAFVIPVECGTIRVRDRCFFCKDRFADVFLEGDWVCSDCGVEQKVERVSFWS